MARLDVLAHGLESALSELRDLAHGIYPPVLRDFGLQAALAAAARRCVPPAALVADGVGRYPADVEAAVYFCCLEGLQNPGKHAGAGAMPRCGSPGNMMRCALRSSTTGPAATSSRLDARGPVSRTCANGSPSSAAR